MVGLFRIEEILVVVCTRSRPGRINGRAGTEKARRALPFAPGFFKMAEDKSTAKLVNCFQYSLIGSVTSLFNSISNSSSVRI
jgi:hypothetical protein